MYDFAVIALLALGMIKLVDFLVDMVPRQIPALRSLLTFGAAIGAVWALDYSVFEGWSYEEIVPPIFDYYDVFIKGMGTGLEEQIYRFIDRDGNILALRPEFTSLVAKTVVTRLNKAPRPIRLYYSGEVLRFEKPKGGRQREFAQIGIEHFGNSGKSSDIEILLIAVEAFERLGIPDFQINLGSVDFFGGIVDRIALPEDQIRAWLDQFQPSPSELLAQEARQLAHSDASAAEAKYREALELAPQDDRLRVDLARLLLKQHRNADSREIVSRLESRGFLEPEAENIKAELELRAAAAESGGVAECRAALAAAPSDLALQLKLSEALGAAQQFQEALDLSLQVVQRGSGELREQARATMVNLFHLLGPEAELTRTFRRRLATALY